MCIELIRLIYHSIFLCNNVLFYTMNALSCTIDPVFLLKTQAGKYDCQNSTDGKKGKIPFSLRISAFLTTVRNF